MALSYPTAYLVKMGATGDTISGIFPLAAILFDCAGSSGATAIKFNGDTGPVLYTATPTASKVTYWKPWAGGTLLVNDIHLETLGSNVECYAVRGQFGTDIARRVNFA